MKKLILVLVAAVSVLGAAKAVDLVLEWDPNNPVEQVTGYNVYELTNSLWLRIGGSASTNLTIPNVPLGKHTYAVQATNLWGFSPFSDSVSTPDMPGKVGGVRIYKK